MDFIYFNLDLSLVAYLKAFAFNKNTEGEVCYVGSAKLFFSLFLKFPNIYLPISLRNTNSKNPHFRTTDPKTNG